MGPIIKNLKSVSGAILMFTILLIGTLWIWNFLSAKGIPGASIVASRLPASAPVSAPQSHSSYSF